MCSWSKPVLLTLNFSSYSPSGVTSLPGANPMGWGKGASTVLMGTWQHKTS